MQDLLACQLLGMLSNQECMQVWVYGVILTAAGTYDHSDAATQKYCRTDQSSVLANSPWFRCSSHNQTQHQKP